MLYPGYLETMILFPEDGGDRRGRDEEKRERRAGELTELYRPWSFFALDLSLTWGPLWILVAGQRLGLLEDGFPLIVIAGLSAVLSALLFVYRTPVRGFARDFWMRAVDPLRIGFPWWMIILGSQLLINALSIVISTFAGGSLDQFELNRTFLESPIAFAVFILFFGPVPEELGWRGYGLDALRSRMHLFHASLLLAIFWALWHVPLVFVEGTFQHGLLEHMPTLVAYFIAFVPGSILMSWIYYRCRRSTLSAIMFHFAGNMSGELFHMTLSTRVIQTVLGFLFAALVVWAERDLFFQREFWIRLESMRGERTALTKKGGARMV